MSTIAPFGVVKIVKLLTMVGVVCLLTLLTNAQPAASQSESSPTQEEAIAIVKPSIVYIDTTWEGVVGFPSNEGIMWSDVITTGSVCSGFFVDPDGYVATAGHCVDPAGGKEAILLEFFSSAVANGEITEEEALVLYSDAISTWPVEGQAAGSAIDRTVDVFQTKPLAGVEHQEPMQADVIEFTPPEQGDNALLKVETSSEVPMLQVAEDKAGVGSDIISAGYPGSVAQVVDTAQEPSFKSGRISSHQTSSGVPFSEIDAAVSSGMSGGPTVNLNGQAVGVNSFNIIGESQHFNFVTDTERLSSMLTRNGLGQELTPTDVAYRKGLSKFFDSDNNGAIAQFDIVLESMPSHKLAQEYKTKAREAVSFEAGAGQASQSDESANEASAQNDERQSEPSNSSSTGILVALGVVVLVGGAVLLLVRRFRWS